VITYAEKYISYLLRGWDRLPPAGLGKGIVD